MKLFTPVNPDTIVLVRHVVKGFFVIAVIALLVTGVWHGTRLSALTMTTVVIEGGETIPHAEVERRAQTVLEGNYLGLIPRRFAWWYPKKEVISKLEQMERIQNIEVDRENNTTLKVSFEEYNPRALWCGPEQGAGCVFLDKNGYAFGQAPNLTGGSFVRFIATGKEAVITETFAETESFQSLLELVELLSLQGWFVSQVELDQVGDAFLTVVGEGELKITTAITPAETVENLLVILASKEFSHLTPGNFQYIDLRFGNKVYVNEEKAEKEGAVPVEGAALMDNY